VRIVVDGNEEDFKRGSTVLALLRGRGEPTTHIVVELNGVFVHPEEYENTELKPGDRVEVVYPAFGG